jgi:hypothetical protein
VSDEPTAVTATWLRYDDVECVRCDHLCGPEYSLVYVVADEGFVCGACITPGEVTRAARGEAT